MMNSKHKQINENQGKSVMYDENWNVVPTKGSFGSGCYGNVMFKCSVCGKLYCTFGCLENHVKKNHTAEKEVI